MFPTHGLASAETVPELVAEDAADNEVLACALAAWGSVLVTDHRHLLSRRESRSVPIHTAAEVVASLRGAG